MVGGEAQAEALIQGHVKEPLKGCWAPDCLVVLKGEAFQEIFSQPSLGAHQPVEVGYVVFLLLDELHLFIQEVISRKSQE